MDKKIPKKCIKCGQPYVGEEIFGGQKTYACASGFGKSGKFNQSRICKIIVENKKLKKQVAALQEAILKIPIKYRMNAFMEDLNENQNRRKN